MKVTFEVDSTQLEDYLLIFDLVTELWRGQIMSSEMLFLSKLAFLTCDISPVERLSILMKGIF